MVFADVRPRLCYPPATLPNPSCVTVALHSDAGDGMARHCMPPRRGGQCRRFHCHNAALLFSTYTQYNYLTLASDFFFLGCAGFRIASYKTRFNEKEKIFGQEKPGNHNIASV